MDTRGTHCSSRCWSAFACPLFRGSRRDRCNASRQVVTPPGSARRFTAQVGAYFASSPKQRGKRTIFAGWLTGQQARLVHRARRLRARAQDAGCDLEPIVQRNPLVKQECRGTLVDLRRFAAPAGLLPANERGSHLFHAASLADRGSTRLCWCDMPREYGFRSVLAIEEPGPISTLGPFVTASSRFR